MVNATAPLLHRFPSFPFFLPVNSPPAPRGRVVHHCLQARKGRAGNKLKKKVKEISCGMEKKIKKNARLLLQRVPVRPALKFYYLMLKRVAGPQEKYVLYRRGFSRSGMESVGAAIQPRKHVCAATIGCRWKCDTRRIRVEGSLVCGAILWSARERESPRKNSDMKAAVHPQQKTLQLSSSVASGEGVSPLRCGILCSLPAGTCETFRQAFPPSRLRCLARVRVDFAQTTQTAAKPLFSLSTNEGRIWDRPPDWKDSSPVGFERRPELPPRS